MNKYQFTNEGFIALQIWLYSLSEEERQRQVNQIESDFWLWATTVFELNELQLSFFNKMKAGSLKFLANQLAFAIANKLPVNLIKNEQPASRAAAAEADDHQGKILETSSSLTNTTDQDGEVTPSGELTIQVTYTS